MLTKLIGLGVIVRITNDWLGLYRRVDKDHETNNKIRDNEHSLSTNMHVKVTNIGCDRKQ